MSESRKNHLDIDGGQVKEDEHVATYKPIPETDTEYKKPNLSKSKEKISTDGAEEKLLQKEKEDEAKITTRVDMADAKYVVGDHRNGDAKIELDANKRQFSGLTKEELLKYADDPFWVRLRWFMFVLFWALWLCMLIGAIVIIVKAPKCAAPPPKKWFETGPLIDARDLGDDYKSIEEKLPLLENSEVLGIFTFGCQDTYEVLDSPTCINQFKEFAAKAKKLSIKLIVDLTANFVSITHPWFAKSENRTEGYNDYFVWAPNKGFKEDNVPNPPNNWISVPGGSAWSWSETRKEFYLHQFAEDQPDLNFSNPEVVRHFDQVIRTWMQNGADGIRLHNARHLLVNPSLPDEVEHRGRGSDPGADHQQYSYWQHKHTTDQLALDALFAHWSHIVDNNATAPGLGETVFTLAESSRPELYLLDHNVSSLRPPSAAPITLEPITSERVLALATELEDRLKTWTNIQLKASSPEASRELVAFSVLLPATPVFSIDQIVQDDNNTSAYEQLMSLRRDASVLHGALSVSSVSANNDTLQLLAVARWKAGHTGYVCVWNPHEEPAAGALTLPAAPDSLQVHYATPAVRAYTNYTMHTTLSHDRVLVPPKSSVLLSFVPNMKADA